MATIRKKGKKWQLAILKKDGFPPVYKSGFTTKQEAKDWAANEEGRQRFYASGGNREAYLAFFPFDSFPKGFFGYVKKSEFIKAVTNKTKDPAES